ncbi:MAG: DUF1328 domain-containing protein [Desulfobulbaceae bacterium]|nr:DUF1328 domain-containing protein [Desulfobulbaceae bacterium]
MYEWALIFFIMAIIAGLFGFTGIAVAFASAAKIFFYIMLTLTFIAFIAGMLPKRKSYSKRLIIDIK